MPSVLITGASRGLGAVTALEFAQTGWQVILLGRDVELLQELASKCNASLEPIVIAADLGDPMTPGHVIANLRTRLPRLDALINNAGVQGPMGLMWETTDSQWEQVLRVNLLAPVAFCRAAIPWMIETGGGSIVNLSGGGATGPRANFTPYGASKAALVRITETMAEECAPFAIRANAVAPGALNTAMLDEVLAAGADRAGAKEYAAALQRAAQGGDSPHRAAACIRWLASPDSAPITGRLLSAVWDRWDQLSLRSLELMATDIYTMRRIAAKDRGKNWDTA